MIKLNEHCLLVDTAELSAIKSTPIAPVIIRLEHNEYGEPTKRTNVREYNGGWIIEFPSEPTRDHWQREIEYEFFSSGFWRDPNQREFTDEEFEQAEKEFSQSRQEILL